MTKRKIIALALTLSMVAILAIGGTLAYFTDTDYAKNVMALGNVDIEQHEKQRDENGALEDFEDNKPVVPAVGEPKWEDGTIAVGGGNQKVFDVENVIDKFVYVENTGKSDAYIRTIVAIEAPGYDPNDLIHVNVNNTVGVTQTAWTPVDIEGVQYVYSVFTYTNPIAANGGVTPVSLAQVYLDPATTNEDVAEYGDTWEILCLSQAVQSDGFADAKTGLDKAFGETTADNVAKWLK